MKTGYSSELGSNLLSEANASMTQSAPDGVFFNSKTVRNDDWKNEISAPYTSATFNRNPGPGTYMSGKTRDQTKAKVLFEESLNIPFKTSADRNCLKQTNEKNPGPGHYIDINNPKNSSSCKSLVKI